MFRLSKVKAVRREGRYQNEYRKVDRMLERSLKEITLARILEADLYL